MDKKIIDVLPKMLTGSELDNALQIIPDYDEQIREKSTAERLIALQDIYSIFRPNAMSREIYSKLYLSLLRSLQKKQSIMAVMQSNQNSRLVRQQSFESIIGGSDSFTIIGESGIGKSSAVSRAVRILCDSPIISINNANIIPCLTVQSPADSSVKGLLLEILRKADEVLSTSYHNNALRSHATVDMLIGSVSQVALTHIGLLIIDEIQNVVNSKNGKTVIGTLTQLINNSGVSICMVGTPESTLFFDQQMMLARRSLGLRYDPMVYGEEFKSFCFQILRYCYVAEKPEINEALYMWLFNHSSGNASIAVSLIHDAQEIAILEGYERLDIVSLNKAFEQRLTMLHDYIAPEKKRYPSAKKEKPSMPEVQPKEVADIICIEAIMLNAKKSQKKVIEELVASGISIMEVVV